MTSEVFTAVTITCITYGNVILRTPAEIFLNFERILSFHLLGRRICQEKEQQGEHRACLAHSSTAKLETVGELLPITWRHISGDSILQDFPLFFKWEGASFNCFRELETLVFFRYVQKTTVDCWIYLYRLRIAMHSVTILVIYLENRKIHGITALSTTCESVFHIYFLKKKIVSLRCI